MPIVGLNCQRVAEEKLPMDLFEVPETLRIQEEKLKKIKTDRNPDQARRALDAIADCCRKDGNLMEVIVESVKSYVTVGEISRTIKDCYGIWKMPLF
jgi:methylmalonyl-CoA mutase N-terminal domain/subunit